MRSIRDVIAKNRFGQFRDRDFFELRIKRLACA